MRNISVFNDVSFYVLIRGKDSLVQKITAMPSDIKTEFCKKGWNGAGPEKTIDLRLHIDYKLQRKMLKTII